MSIPLDLRNMKWSFMVHFHLAKAILGPDYQEGSGQ